MGKQTTIWIMSVLFGLGIFAAYHSDNKHAARSKAIQVEYRSNGVDVVLEKSKDLLAEELAKDGIQVQSVVFTEVM